LASELEPLLFGLIISLVLGVFAFRKEALSKTGTLAAVLLGVTVFVLGGPAWFATLAVFFLTGVFLTSFRAKEKQDVVREFAKGGLRDFWQVLANGGIAGLLALAWSYYKEPLVFYAFLGVIATITADTWATELGILQKGKPRLITTWQPVPVGTSGAVSSMGLGIAFAGGLLIGLAAVVFLKIAGSPLLYSQDLLRAGAPIAIIAAFSGLAGAAFDSLLGATVQAMYYCTRCKRETEKTLHNCGEKTQAIRGFKWFDNDIVNLASSMFGALTAAALYLLWF